MTLPRGILLAAGASSRFGANKLLHPLADGTPIAVASARTLLAALPGALAVVRPGSERLQALLRDAGCQVTVCPRAEEGMGLSLAHAVAASAHEGMARAGWVVALADMPFLQPATIRAVADSIAAGALIAAPALRGERGHPVGFAASLMDELLALQGDEGARSLLKRHAGAVHILEVGDAGIHKDIDRQADVPAPGIRPK